MRARFETAVPDVGEQCAVCDPAFTEDDVEMWSDTLREIGLPGDPCSDVEEEVIEDESVGLGVDDGADQ